jgi:hypothetical protein
MSCFTTTRPRLSVPDNLESAAMTISDMVVTLSTSVMLGEPLEWSSMGGNYADTGVPENPAYPVSTFKFPQGVMDKKQRESGVICDHVAG